ncbi:MAG: hypothetical protein ACK5SU_09695, partial [Phenylobacterium sp.]
RIHARLKLTGHLWQGRFSSTAMDERHLIAAARYLALNPVAAGLVKRHGYKLGYTGYGDTGVTVTLYETLVLSDRVPSPGGALPMTRLARVVVPGLPHSKSRCLE